MNLDEKIAKYPQYGRTMPFYKGGRGFEVNTMEFDGDLEITSAFEGGNGENFIRQGKDHFSMELRADPVPISEAVPVGTLCVQVSNYGATPRQAKLDIIVHPILREMNWTHVVKSDYFIKRQGAWSQLPVEKTICGENIYRLLIDVAPGEQVVVANEMPYPYSQLLVDLEALVAAHPGRVLRRSFGNTVQGRDLPVLTFGERPNAPRLALACTPQPNEPATWFIMGAANFLVSADPAAAEILSRYVVDLLPMTVPDGVVAGWGKINAQGIQPLFEMERSANGQSECVEANLEWAWFSQHPPVAFAEMHISSKRCADRPTQPYVMDRALYSTPARREVARQMDMAVIGLHPDGNFRNIAVGDPTWRKILCYQLTARYDTISYLYQIIGLTIPDGQRLTVELLKTMARLAL